MCFNELIKKTVLLVVEIFFVLVQHFANDSGEYYAQCYANCGFEDCFKIHNFFFLFKLFLNNGFKDRVLFYRNDKIFLSYLFTLFKHSKNEFNILSLPLNFASISLMLSAVLCKIKKSHKSKMCSGTVRKL